MEIGERRDKNRGLVTETPVTPMKHTYLKRKTASLSQDLRGRTHEKEEKRTYAEAAFEARRESQPSEGAST